MAGHFTRSRLLFTTFSLTAGLTASPVWSQPLRGTQAGQLQSPLSPAERCTECHSGGMTSTGATYMAADTWPASMMANAQRDPLFQATLAVAEQDSPGIGSLCYRCHSPSAFTAGRAERGQTLDPLQGDSDGVHCDTCHRSVVPTNDPNAPYVSNAQLFYSDAPMDMIPTRYGPHNDPMISPRHPSMGSSFIRDARMCGQCHDLTHPTNTRRMADGTDTRAPFPLQSTYTEWAQSDFARRAAPETCQTCHMPEITGESLPSTRIPNAPNRARQRRHDFLGANEWGMALLKAAFPGERDEEYDASRRRIQDYLRTAAEVTFTDVPRTAAAGSTVRVTVRVTNRSGHKLPTGYEDARVMWLQLQVGDRVISGDYANDELVSDRQVRVYQFKAGYLQGGQVLPSDFVVRHNVVMEDTRIPPLGMMPDARTMPVGRDYSGGPNGALRNYDTVTYDVPVPASIGTVSVRARLMYRTTTKHYVEAIVGANRTDGRGRALMDAWNRSGRAAPFAMAEATATVTVTAPQAPGDDGGGCAVARAGDRTNTNHHAPWALGALVAGLAAWRRRARKRQG